MNNNELTQAFNDFFIKTGIREYCSKVCHGECCVGENCHAKRVNDYNVCHDKLICTVYYCNDIYFVLHELDPTNTTKMNKLREDVSNSISKYFEENGHITDREFPQFSNEFYNKINKRMKMLVKNKTLLKHII